MTDADIEFRLGYAWDASLRGALVGAYTDVFDIDVARFDALNAWDPDAVLFSGFDRGRLITNVMLLPVSMTCDGRSVRAAAAVLGFTDAAYRGRGLYRRVFGALAAFADNHFELSFLFTDKPAVYAGHGFRVVSDDWFELPLPGASRTSPARVLDDDRVEDLTLLRRLLRERAPVSDVLGFTHDESLFLYNELQRGFRRVHHAESLDAAIVFEMNGDTLRLLDVVCREMPSYEAILRAALAASPQPVGRIECCFTPDRLGVAGRVCPRAHEDVLMVRGAFPIEDRAFAFPPTAYC